MKASLKKEQFFLYKILKNPLLELKVFRFFLLLISFLFLIIVVVTPFDLKNQFLFSSLIFLFSFFVNKLKNSRIITVFLIFISMVASLRYMYWRINYTLGFDSLLDGFFGFGLFAAELYAFTVLIFSYFQSAWPLKRQPLLMVGELTTWPTVDIYIPTYNEPLSVVRQTIITALSQDWPKDKYKIYVLDDGNRPEFGAFCKEVGVGYITRNNNRHAKAGNINQALPQTQGEFIAIFDCDHVPTRSFLQICMGWFQRDSNLAMLQTPHVFFSPDPLEQNLDVFNKVPNEGQLFYGLTQDGNDLWNATFFCGSCAVLRRSALLEVGGIAVESVTEDALTALKMNTKGYSTAYLALPQAAGLATESLSRHIGQRIRWARGMTQIFRNYNPLLIKGLNLAQRICYTSAALHFFYGLPRLVFLTAPLAYLFFGAHVFDASALMIAAYAMPHIMHAQLTNSRIQGKFRHSFWNEVYETVLAWYIMRPTLATMITPSRATFNVTQKGGTVETSYFDWTLSRPYIILLLLNLAGLITGISKIYIDFDDKSIVLTLLINMVWTIHNIVICSASIAVAGERRQVRSSPRVQVKQWPVTLALPTGHRYVCEMTDFSQEGLGVKTPLDLGLKIGDYIQVSLFNNKESVFTGKIAFNKNQKLGIYLENLNLEQQVELAQLTFARADIWANSWHDVTPDTPLGAMRQIGKISCHGFLLLIKESYLSLKTKIKKPLLNNTSEKETLEPK